MSLYLLYRPRYGPPAQRTSRFRFTVEEPTPDPESLPDDDDVLALFAVARRA